MTASTFIWLQGCVQAQAHDTTSHGQGVSERDNPVAGAGERPASPAVAEVAQATGDSEQGGPGCVADFCDGEPSVVDPDDGPQNVLGGALQACSTEPLTGFFRTGSCETGPQDRGNHAVCAVMTDAFLEYTRSQGNDLSTPSPTSRFPGLNAGDRWCLCAARWEQARRAGVAPLVDLAATNESALQSTTLDDLQSAVSAP